MALNDPFGGRKEPQQAGPAPATPIEQKLFRRPLPTPSAPAPAPPQSPPTENQHTEPAPATAPVSPRKEKGAPPPGAPRRFDLREQPLYKNSFLFTQEEAAVLDELKLELCRQLDTKITKNDLIRCALHMLAEDHATKREGSYVVRKVGKREPK